VEAIDRITSYVQGIENAASLERDHKTQAAVIRYIETIGEAANRIHKQEPQFISAHSSLPWHEMRGMRNRMIHNYFDVNVDVLWGTAKEDLPKLKPQIERLLTDVKREAGREQ
jgi:uncharacterized protein with HEPN domain